MMNVILCLALAWLIYDVGRFRRLIVGKQVPRLTTPRHSHPKEVATSPVHYPGAVPPNSWVVVRWPGEIYHYKGCAGAEARQKYEYNHPAPGEAVEIWNLGTQRGRKIG